MSTPPPPPLARNAPPTPEQVRQIERNRHLAKARLQRAAKSSLPSVEEINSNRKRPLVVEKDDASPQPEKALKRDERLGKYYDYNLSTLKDSKGGFLVPDSTDDPHHARELQQIETLRLERERASEKAGLLKNGKQLEYIIPSDPELRPKCERCSALDVDVEFLKVFKVMVCRRCKNEVPDKYSLLTKTECKDDYLLTDPELKDNEILPHLLKANPHRSTYSNMMLFLRFQVEEFAIKKWGSLEKLDEEFERREALKKKKKNKKFEERLKELRKRTTRKGGEQERVEKAHVHVWKEEQKGKKVCECGVEIEEEVF